MNSRRKNFFISFLKYTVSLTIALFLFWWVYGDFNFRQIFQRFSEVDINYIFISLGFGIISYIVRAFRWSLLFEPLGYKISTFRALISLMVGYFANLLVPRMGEITRCGILKKTDNVEFTSSFGTVIAERTVDMICLFIVIFIGFGIEFKILRETFISNFGNTFQMLTDNQLLISISIVVVVGIMVLIYFLIKKFKHQIFRSPVLLKVRSIARSLMDGFFSVRRLEKPYLFWISTLLIWVMYFLMTYVVFLSFGPTMHLGIKAGILVLILGGLGMATPVQGGVGAFHLFVSSVLLLYGISESNGEFFAFVLHTSQFLLMLVVGGISFIVSLVISKKNLANVNKG